MTGFSNLMNIVFDLGMVLIQWDPRNVYRKVFADEAKMEWFLANVCHHEWNLAQDGGRSFDDGVAEATARFPEYAAEIAMYRDRWMEMVPGAIEGSVRNFGRAARQTRAALCHYQLEWRYVSSHA